MTQSTDQLSSTALARALWNISNLLLRSRLTLAIETDQAADQRLGGVVGYPPPTTLVCVDATACPVERDELVAAMGEPAPFEWHEDERTFRGWRGEVLTMQVLVQETLPGSGGYPLAPMPPARDPAGDQAEPGPLTCLGAPGGFIADCNLPGPHGPHSMEEAPHEPPAVGVAVAADGRDSVAQSYGRYARALFVFHHSTVIFEDEAAVLASIDGWLNGRHMLTSVDIGELVRELAPTIPPPVPEPEPAPEASPDLLEQPPIAVGVADIGRGRPYVEQQNRGAWLFRRRNARRRSGGHRANSIGAL